LEEYHYHFRGVFGDGSRGGPFPYTANENCRILTFLGAILLFLS
jgi:hypothetical protein